MRKRIQKLDRVVKVQRHLHRSAELRLAGLERESAELKAAQETLIETMNDHETLHGLFVDVMAKRLQALAAQATRTDAAKAVQKAATFERAMQVKRTEKTLSGLNEESRKENEKKDLIAILETMRPRGPASFP
jgi:uncharacterized coiled-coil protein SlyX